MQHVWFLFNSIEAMLGLGCIFCHLQGSMDNKEPMPHYVFICGIFFGFTMISMMVAVGVCFFVMISPLMEMIICSLAFFGYITISIMGMVYVETDFHNHYLSKYDEPTHPYFAKNRLQSICSLMTSSIYLMNFTLACDAYFFTRKPKEIPKYRKISAQDRKLAAEKLEDSQLVFLSRSIENQLNRMKCFRRISGYKPDITIIENETRNLHKFYMRHATRQSAKWLKLLEYKKKPDANTRGVKTNTRRTSAPFEIKFPDQHEIEANFIEPIELDATRELDNTIEKPKVLQVPKKSLENLDEYRTSSVEIVLSEESSLDSISVTDNSYDDTQQQKTLRISVAQDSMIEAPYTTLDIINPEDARPGDKISARYKLQNVVRRSRAFVMKPVPVKHDKSDDDIFYEEEEELFEDESIEEEEERKEGYGVPMYAKVKEPETFEAVEESVSAAKDSTKLKRRFGKLRKYWQPLRKKQKTIMSDEDSDKEVKVEELTQPHDEPLSEYSTEYESTSRRSKDMSSRTSDNTSHTQDSLQYETANSELETSSDNDTQNNSDKMNENGNERQRKKTKKRTSNTSRSSK